MEAHKKDTISPAPTLNPEPSQLTITPFKDRQPEPTTDTEPEPASKQVAEPKPEPNIAQEPKPSSESDQMREPATEGILVEYGHEMEPRPYSPL